MSSHKQHIWSAASCSPLPGNHTKLKLCIYYTTNLHSHGTSVTNSMLYAKYYIYIYISIRCFCAMQVEKWSLVLSNLTAIFSKVQRASFVYMLTGLNVCSLRTNPKSTLEITAVDRSGQTPANLLFDIS